MRQALFNSLQTVIPDARVLDLFAGAGSLGYEALSRGAASVTFVENGRQALKLLDLNAQELGVRERVKILGESLENLSSVASRLERFGPFDLVLADPPYEGGWEEKLLQQISWERLLVPEGFFCLEWGLKKSQIEELPSSVQNLVKVREKNYGDSVLTTYQRI